MNHKIDTELAYQLVNRLRDGGFEPRTTGFQTWVSRCPIHLDDEPSLRVALNHDGTFSVHCRHADASGRVCSIAEIIRAVGLSWAGESPLRVVADAADPPRLSPRAEGASEASSETQAPEEVAPDDDDSVSSSGAVDGAAPLSANGDDKHNDSDSDGDGEIHSMEAFFPRAEAGDESERDAATRAIFRIAARAKLLRGVDGRFYASVPNGDHAECHELRSAKFERWLTWAYCQEENRIAPPMSLKRVVALLEANAEQIGALQTAYVRVGGTDGADSPSSPEARYYIDLGDETLRAIAIRPGCWEVVDRPPVQFRRPSGLAALPMPRRGGAIDLLRDFVNVADEDFWLLVAWLTAALRPVGPYPVLILVGEQGSAKTTTARVARRLIDPHGSLLRPEPDSRRDLMVGARNNWLLAFDNVSAIRGWLSDSLCRLATGGSFAARKLFADDEESHWSAQRPVILNGIGDLVRRGDLVDRSLILHLPPILGADRKYEEELWAAFAADSPLLLGALLDAVAGGLRLLPEVQLASRPRMADFARWGEAVTRALGQPPDTFLDAYDVNRLGASRAEIEDSPVARAVLVVASRLGSWSGTASDLLKYITTAIDDPESNLKRIPRSAAWLGEQLRRVAPQLRMVGVTITFRRGPHSRMISIEDSRR